jgi:sulfur dioxygenase
MYLQRFIEPETKTQTYIIHTKNNLALVIDPVFAESDKYLKFLTDNSLNLIYSLDTHVHADHITAASLLRKKTGCKIVIGEYADVISADIKVADSDILPFDDLIIKVIYTPGHTIESCCFLINDKLFTGDTLLINACGRTDFQNGSSELLYDSIFKKILILPEETLIYPAHDYNNRTVSTVMEEVMNNPRLQVKSCHEFMHIMDNLNLPKPKYIDIALPRNKLCGDEL